MQPLQRRLFLVVTALAATLSSTACESTPEPAYSYYEDQIAPVVRIGCAQQTTGCHIASPEGTAAGRCTRACARSIGNSQPRPVTFQ